MSQLWKIHEEYLLFHAAQANDLFPSFNHLDIVKKHNEIALQHESCWYGKGGDRYKAARLDAIGTRAQANQGVPLYLMFKHLDQWRYYQATLLETARQPSDPNLVPAYYRDQIPHIQKCWFRITSWLPVAAKVLHPYCLSETGKALSEVIKDKTEGVARIGATTQTSGLLYMAVAATWEEEKVQARERPRRRVTPEV